MRNKAQQPEPGLHEPKKIRITMAPFTIGKSPRKKYIAIGSSASAPSAWPPFCSFSVIMRPDKWPSILHHIFRKSSQMALPFFRLPIAVIGQAFSRFIGHVDGVMGVVVNEQSLSTEADQSGKPAEMVL